jgi:hypothetical protein
VPYLSSSHFQIAPSLVKAFAKVKLKIWVGIPKAELANIPKMRFEKS